MAFKAIHQLTLKLTSAQIKIKKILIHRNTKMCLQLLSLFKKEGFIVGFSFFKINDCSFVKIFLKYQKFCPTIRKIRLISSPSRRIFFRVASLVKFNINNGLLILSTNKGLMTHQQCCRYRLGGEAIMFIG
jgi:ribosomal protein S8